MPTSFPHLSCLQVFRGNPDPQYVSPFMLLQSRQAVTAGGASGRGTNPYFNAFSQASMGMGLFCLFICCGGMCCV